MAQDKYIIPKEIWLTFVRWLARDEIARARIEGRAFTEGMTARERQQEFSEGTLHGINLMQAEIDRVVAERTGGMMGEPSVEDLIRARRGLLH